MRGNRGKCFALFLSKEIGGVTSWKSKGTKEKWRIGFF